MFTFQMLDLVILLTAVLILLVGMVFLALRRRDDILQEFLTPDEPNIEIEFFRKQPVVPEQEPESETEDESTGEDEVSTSWGYVDEAERR